MFCVVMPFSWEQAKLRAIDVKLRRAKLLAGGGSKASPANPDFKIKHPDWVRDVNTANISVMNKKVKDEVIKMQETAIVRRLKTIGK